ncbi:MAG TPA: hypothetical protein VMF87_30310 [Streptosporangiaceae bacterium]|nr:hypothetical protein [Streptosporangiaceae bacterium]
MDDSRAARLVEVVLRCYPARWRRRHGAEAAELGVLLIRDGTPVGAIAWSYLAGAVREWLTPRSGWRATAVACALLVAACSLGASAELLASAGPARAASTSQAHRPARCRPGSLSLEAVPGVMHAMSHPQLLIWEAGHGWSC